MHADPESPDCLFVIILYALIIHYHPCKSNITMLMFIYNHAYTHNNILNDDIQKNITTSNIKRFKYNFILNKLRFVLN